MITAKRLILKITAGVLAVQMPLRSAQAVKFEKAPSLKQQELIDGFDLLRPEKKVENFFDFVKRAEGRMSDTQKSEFYQLNKVDPRVIMPKAEIKDAEAWLTVRGSERLHLKADMNKKGNVDFQIDNEKFVITTQMGLTEAVQLASTHAQKALAKYQPKQSLLQWMLLPRAQADIGEWFSNNWSGLLVGTIAGFFVLPKLVDAFKGQKYTCPSSTPTCCVTQQWSGGQIVTQTNANGQVVPVLSGRMDNACCNHGGKTAQQDGYPDPTACYGTPINATTTTTSSAAVLSAGAASAVKLAPSSNSDGKASAAVVKPSYVPQTPSVQNEGQK